MMNTYCTSLFVWLSYLTPLAAFTPSMGSNERRSRCHLGLQAESVANDHTYLPIQVVDSMPEWLPEASKLKNQYYLLRHGQSTSNVEGIISSDRTLAYSSRHGLTELGETQAADAAQPLLELIQSHEKSKKDTMNTRVVFCASPFARAHETAQVCRDRLVQLLASSDTEASLAVDETIDLRDELVERNFGRLDGQELFTYAYVWPLDKFNVTHTAFGTESVAAVCHRIRQCILQLEQDYQNCHIILTSHADVLQITQLYAAQHDNVGEFSSFRFTNGEVRPMTVGSTANLPPPSPLPRPVRGTFIA